MPQDNHSTHTSCPPSRIGEPTPRTTSSAALVHAEEEGDTLNEQEMLNMLRLLLIAGNETTTNLIGNGMLALLRHPDQLSVLRDDPSLMPAAVNELLRFDSPVQSDFRTAVEDCEVNGVRVRGGENIILLLGAANHDPAVFEEPERLDVRRREGNHIAFGRGIHHCLGAFLARWRPESPSRCCLNASPRSTCSPTVRYSAVELCCAASNPCPSAPVDPGIGDRTLVIRLTDLVGARSR